MGPARSVHAAAWDGRRLLLHAGSGEGIRDDLWIFDGTWTTLPGAASKRQDHVAVWDPVGEALWIHGGYDGSNFLKDAWTYSGNSWSVLALSTQGPRARAEHVAVWDTGNSALYIHGGFDGLLLGDLWCLNSAGWIQIAGFGEPSARAQHVAAWDEARSVIWLHGGYDGGVQSAGLRRDLWSFDTKSYAWTLISESGPSARAYHAAAWDPTTLALWIHGGFDSAACQDLWKFDTYSTKWELLADAGPSPRYSHVAFWDVDTSSFWVHGGYDGNLCRDLWRFDVTTTTTTSEVTSTSSTSSSATTTSTTLTTSSTSGSNTFSTSSFTTSITVTRITSTRSSSTTQSSTVSSITSSTSATFTVSTTSGTTLSRTTSTTVSFTSTSTSSQTSTTSGTSTTTRTHTSSSTSSVSSTTSGTTTTTSTHTSSSTLSSTSTSTRSSTTTNSLTSTSTVSSTTTSTMTMTITTTTSYSSTSSVSTTSTSTATHSSSTTTFSSSSTVSTSTSTISTSTATSTSSSTSSSTGTSVTITSSTGTSTSKTTSTQSTSSSSQTSWTATSSTSTTQTSSQSSSTSSSTTFTSSTMTSSTGTRSTSFTTTISTSTSTTTTTRPEDVTALLVLCPLLGVLTVVLLAIAIAWWILMLKRRNLVMDFRSRAWQKFNTQSLVEPSPRPRPPRPPSPQLSLHPPKLKPSGSKPSPHRDLAFHDLPLCIAVDFAPLPPSVHLPLPGCMDRTRSPLRPGHLRRKPRILVPTQSQTATLVTPATPVPMERLLERQERLAISEPQPRVETVRIPASAKLELELADMKQLPGRAWQGIVRMTPVQLDVSSLYLREAPGPSLLPQSAGPKAVQHLGPRRVPREVTRNAEILRDIASVQMRNSTCRAPIMDLARREPLPCPAENHTSPFPAVRLSARGSPRSRLPNRREMPASSPVLFQPSHTLEPLERPQPVEPEHPHQKTPRLPKQTEPPPVLQAPAVARRPLPYQVPPRRISRGSRSQRVPFYDPEDPDLFGRIPGLVFGFPRLRRDYGDR